jgi:hypothetical protein
MEEYGKVTYRERWSRRTRYVDQLHYISGRILGVLDDILAAPGDPVIVLQSDHGSASQDFWLRPPPPVAYERMANLTALRLPGFKGQIAKDFTNVNTFRLIFDAYLGTSYGQLPNRCYYSYIKPYDFVDVTDVLAGPPPDFKAFHPTKESKKAAGVVNGQ